MRIKRKQIIYRDAMKHQLEYIEWGIPRDHVACLMEMRLGKTLANIRLIKEWSEFDKIWYTGNDGIFPILVVCPGAVIETWERELFLEGERYVVVHGKTFNKRVETTVNEAFTGIGRTWIIINYESLLYTPGLSLLPWFCVVLDESTVIKNPQSKISMLCTGPENFVDVKHRVILTGLPSPEGPLDLFQQYYFLNRRFLNCPNYYIYRSIHFRLSWDGWQPKPSSAEKIKKFVHSRSFIKTRQEAGIGSKRIKEYRYIDMTPEQRKTYDTLEKEYLFVLDDLDKEEIETDHVIVQQTWLARICGGCDNTGQYRWNPKLKELIYLLKGELSQQPVVVWFRFDATIKYVYEELKKKGIACETLTGADSRIQKKAKQEWFRTSKIKGRVILSQQQKVAEYGVDMSEADVAIYYEFVYSGQTNSQTLERIENPMKKRPLLYIYFVMKNSLDEDALEVIRTKVRNAKMFLKKMKYNLRKRLENRK